ncbi:ATP-binding protein [Chloroflexota bacterium]
MTIKVMRKIVNIDEDKCTGCGICIPNCVEGALQIVDGKARLIKEIYCDGLGACLGECSEDAITIEERVADEFDEDATNEHMSVQAVHEPEPCGCPGSAVRQFEAPARAEEPQPCGCQGSAVRQFEAPVRVEEPLPCGCPGSSVRQFETPAQTVAAASSQRSTLTQWPVQLTLVPPSAPFLNGADLLLVADCVPFAYAGFHQDMLRDHAVLVACPKLDSFEAHQQKLNQIISQSGVRSLTVVHMEVPCCFGIVQMAQEAVRASGRDIPFKDVTVGVQGDILES